MVSLPRLSVRATLAALPAMLKQRAREETYRVYMTESLRLIAENTARAVNGGYLKTRYAELFEQKPESASNEDRSSDEIIDHMKKKLSSL